ncbi:hypothetical protein V6N13_097059 [Hibiscus sabdariffa]|uniref:Uncharacterized protein n=1 Tax=Hibiscus sabdariffa TaxID=183260 RepID=A0ABR2BZD3_9ROSI
MERRRNGRSKGTQEDNKKELCAGGDDDDDGDGFKTPTSSEHKIPEPKTCPPAPTRPRPLKRKAPPAPTHSSSAAALVVGNLLQLQLDFSKRVRKASPQEKP